jgi:hypothetical protein
MSYLELDNFPGGDIFSGEDVDEIDPLGVSGEVDLMAVSFKVH